MGRRQLRGGFNNSRQEQSDLFATRNPALNAPASPVPTFSRCCEDFRIDGTRATLQITKINQRVSETALRATISRTLVNVRNAYWDLVYAIEAAEVAERSLRSPRGSSRTTRRALKSGRSRRWTSCRHRLNRRTAAGRSHRRPPPGARRNSP